MREKDIQSDCLLMESLFQNDLAKSQRLLAVLTSHNRPINCVRWNNLGTMFASADDEGTIILWEYRGLTIQSAFQASQFGGYGNFSTEDAKNAFESCETEKKQDIMEDWRSLKTWKGHRGRSKLVS